MIHVTTKSRRAKEYLTVEVCISFHCKHKAVLSVICKMEVCLQMSVNRAYRCNGGGPTDPGFDVRSPAHFRPTAWSHDFIYLE